MTSFNGKRVRIIKADHEPRFIGITGYVQGSEDGYDLIIDRPLPEWCMDYEDTRSGRVIIASHGRHPSGRGIDYSDEGLNKQMADIAEIIDESAPANAGSGVGPDPMEAMRQSIAQNLGGLGITGISFADDDGNVAHTLDFSDHKEQKHLFAISYGAYLKGEGACPAVDDYGLDYVKAGEITRLLKEAKDFADATGLPFRPESVILP